MPVRALVRQATRLVIAIVVLASSGCAGDSPEPMHAPAASAGRRLDLANDAAFRARIDEIRLHNAIEAPTRAVFRDRASWEAFWSRATGVRQPVLPAPVVDFSRHMVVVVALGARPTGGHWVHVESVHETPDALRVEALASSPGARCVTTQAFTQPLDAVLVARASGPVTYRVSEVVRDCR